jgi:hypothetical protein
MRTILYLIAGLATTGAAAVAAVVTWIWFATPTPEEDAARVRVAKLEPARTSRTAFVFSEPRYTRDPIGTIGAGAAVTVRYAGSGFYHLETITAPLRSREGAPLSDGEIPEVAFVSADDLEL